MFKKLFILSAMSFALAAVAQQQQGLPDNKDLISRARTVYVESDTFYMKREALESSLLGRKEFKAWDLRITDGPTAPTCWSASSAFLSAITSPTPLPTAKTRSS